MPRTRSTKPSGSQSKSTTDTPVSSSASKYTLVSDEGPLSQVFILPKTVTSSARIVTLPDPRHGQPSRYLVCPKAGIHEFTKIAAPKSDPRSWLVENKDDDASSEAAADKKDSSRQIQLISSSDMFVATSIDPLFLVLPSLADVKLEKGSNEKKRLFLSSDDHFDKLPEESSHLSEILHCDATRSLLESRMSAICDTVDAGDEKMFRLNESKLLTIMVEKAKRMSKGGLPSTMEEKFVKKALEAPLLQQKNSMAKPAEVQLATAPDSAAESEISTPLTESGMSQSTIVTADSGSSFNSQPSTAATSFAGEGQPDDVAVTAIQASPEVTALQRLRVAFDFICSKYIPSDVAEDLRRSLSQVERSAIDFSPLERYLAELAELRAEAVAASSVADYSRKRPRDEEEDELRAEKKRKAEEEKKRKANESRGVRDLKKVNTSGMKKLSFFFNAKS